MLKIVGGDFTASGLAIRSLLIPIRRGETWACWAALAVAGANWVPAQYVTISLRLVALTAEHASSVKRYARPEEVGKVVAFLASECASYITGCTIQVDGGAIAGIEIKMISDWISAK